MQTIPDTFKHNGFMHEVIKRKGRNVLIRKTLPVTNFEGYEVASLRFHPAGERFGKHYPDRLLMPSSEQWGTYGWSPLTLEDAENRFRQLSRG